MTREQQQRAEALLAAFNVALAAAKRKRLHRTDEILMATARFGSEAMDLLRKLINDEKPGPTELKSERMGLS